MPPVAAEPHTGRIMYPDNRIASVEDLFETTLRRLAPRSVLKSSQSPEGIVLFITGTTGLVGSYLLRDVLLDPRIYHVYSHSRPGKTSVYERHVSSFQELKLDDSLLSSEKLTFLEGDLLDDFLGLDAGTYENLLGKVNTVIHNAWYLDLNAPMSTFEPLVVGSVNVLNFSQRLHSPSVRFIFSSTNSTMQNFGCKGRMPEKIVLDTRVCLGCGYGESKYVVERLIARSQVNGCAVRMPQLYGGHPLYLWSKSGWLPRLVKSSLTLGQFPVLYGMAEWLSAESTATALHEIVVHEGELPSAVNFIHPQPTPFVHLGTWINERIFERSNGAVRFSPYIPGLLWLERLRRLQVNGTPLRSLPALRLEKFFGRFLKREYRMDDVPFIGAYPAVDTALARKLCPSLDKASPIDKATVSGWVDHWIREGYLNIDTPALARL